ETPGGCIARGCRGRMRAPASILQELCGGRISPHGPSTTAATESPGRSRSRTPETCRSAVSSRHLDGLHLRPPPPAGDELLVDVFEGAHARLKRQRVFHAATRGGRASGGGLAVTQGFSHRAREGL